VGGLGGLFAGAMLIATAAGAAANFAFCMDDPPVTAVTPGGHYVTVNTQVYLPAGSEQLLNDVYAVASTQPDGRGGTLVTVNVYVPAQAHVVASVNRYQVSATGDGDGVVTLHLDLPIS
jgi:hypothetical protein